ASSRERLPNLVMPMPSFVGKQREAGPDRADREGGGEAPQHHGGGKRLVEQEVEAAVKDHADEPRSEAEGEAAGKVDEKEAHQGCHMRRTAAGSECSPRRLVQAGRPLPAGSGRRVSRSARRSP